MKLELGEAPSPYFLAGSVWARNQRPAGYSQVNEERYSGDFGKLFMVVVAASSSRGTQHQGPN